MRFIKLSTVIDEDGRLCSDMIVKHTLSQEMVIYGFVPVYSNEGFIALDSDLIPMNEFHVCCNVLTAKSIKDGCLRKPIFDEVQLCDEQKNLPLSEIYVPELAGKTAYNRLRSYKTTQYGNDFSQLGVIEKIKDNPEQYVYHASVGEYLFFIEDMVRGVGNEILVICRFINSVTGSFDYSIFRPSELFVECQDDPEEDPDEQNKLPF